MMAGIEQPMKATFSTFIKYPVVVIAKPKGQLLVLLSDITADGLGVVKSNGVPATAGILPVGIKVSSTGVNIFAFSINS